MCSSAFISKERKITICRQKIRHVIFFQKFVYLHEVFFYLIFYQLQSLELSKCPQTTTKLQEQNSCMKGMFLAEITKCILVSTFKKNTVLKKKMLKKQITLYIVETSICGFFCSISNSSHIRLTFLAASSSL